MRCNDAVFAAADQTPQIFLIVKPHPVENVRKTRALLGKSQNIIFAEPQSDIRELTTICDAFVSFGSTATIDALIAGKLTICPIFPGWVFSDLFKEQWGNTGSGIRRGDDKLIQDDCEWLLSHDKRRLEPARQAFLKRWVYRTDGMAAARVEALALKLAGMGQT